MYKSFFLIFLLTLVSCSNHELDVLFDQAERNIQPEPEKAYALLSTIDSNNISSRSHQARYALLMSHAMYKCYYDAPNDSLISIAYDYYVTDNHGSDHDRMTAAMLLGYEQRRKGHTEDAMLTLQRSLDFALKTDDYFSIGHVYANLAALCLYIYDSDELNYAEQSVYYYEKAGMEDYALDAKGLLAGVYYNRGEYDRSLALADSIRPYFEKIGDPYSCARTLRTIFHSNLSLGNIEAAESSYRELSNLPTPDSITAMLIRTSYYLAVGKLDSAKIEIESTHKLPEKVFDRINYYQDLSRVYKNAGEFEKALASYTIMHQLKDSVMIQRLSHSVTVAQRDFVSNKLEINQYRQRQVRMLWFFLFVILLVVFIAVLVFFYKNQLTHKLEMERTMLLVSEIKQALHNKQGELDRLSGQVSTMKEETLRNRDQLLGLFSKQFSTLDSLFVTYFSGQNIMYEKNAIYKEVQRIVKSFSSDQSTFLEIENLVNQEYDGILVNLRQDFPTMKEVDYRLFCFTAVGFSSRAISLLVDETVENVYQKRTRWKSKIEKSTSRRKQDYLTILG